MSRVSRRQLGMQPLESRRMLVAGFPGDFDADGQITVADIDLLSAEIRSGSNESFFDINSDGAVSLDDQVFLINDILQTYFGDANLDFEFNSSDWVHVFTIGEYETSISVGWAGGDWDASGFFTSTDIVTALLYGGYEAGPRVGAPIGVSPEAQPLAAGGAIKDGVPSLAYFAPTGELFVIGDGTEMTTIELFSVSESWLPGGPVLPVFDLGLSQKLFYFRPDGTERLDLGERLPPDVSEATLRNDLRVNGSQFGGGQVIFDLAYIAGDAQVVAERIFYNNSSFDGNDITANAADVAAIATDKMALRPGQTATVDNYTNFKHGINGLMVEIAGATCGADISLDDFQFHIQDPGNPSTWIEVTPSPTLTVDVGAGTGESDRVTIIFPDGTIQNTWLRVTVLSNPLTTGLAENDVFYFGNLVGDTSNSLAAATVDYGDVLRVFQHASPTVGVEATVDIDRSGVIDSDDVALMLQNIFNSLPLISVPSAAAGSSATDTALAELEAEDELLPRLNGRMRPAFVA